MGSFIVFLISMVISGPIPIFRHIQIKFLIVYPIEFPSDPVKSR
jgi:hypothetical protein